MVVSSPERSPSRWPFAIVPSVIMDDERRESAPQVVPAMPLYNRQEAPLRVHPPYDQLDQWTKDVVHLLSSDPTLRCLNVRQPWASMIVEGTKTVENRPAGANRPHFHKQDGLGEWVLIVASASRPTRKALTDALQDYQRRYGLEEGCDGLMVERSFGALQR